MKHNTLIFLILISLSTFVACKQEEKQQSQSESEELRLKDSLLQQDLNYPKQIIALSEKAQNETQNWMLYAAMDSEIKRMEKYTLEDVIENAPSILLASDTLIKTIPKLFRTKSIESRAKVLHSKASVLLQLSQKQQQDLAKLKEVAEEIPIDFYNLNIQLNEVFIEMPNLETLEK